MLSDGDHIRNLLGRYCELIDAADHAGVGRLFGTTGVLAAEDGTVLARGEEEVAGFYRGLVTLHDGEQRTKHLVADTVLEPEGDDRMTARSSFLVLQATDELPLQPIMAGRYVDTFERGPDGWRWLERRFTADLTGHLSQHLRRL